MIGRTVVHYRVTEKLGEGAMGVVYKAHDTRLDRDVALKFLASQVLTDVERKRFVAEAQAAARIQHPNICPIHEISEHDGQLFFAMAFVNGKTVSQLLADGPLPVDTALDIAIQVAVGLDAAHRHGIVHRDIKSSNIAVDLDGHAWILDFGIALREDADRLTSPGGAVGTPAFMSPEQARGGAVDHRTDLWSLGVVLFEMLTGQLPFERSRGRSVLHAIVSEKPPPLTSVRPHLPAALDQFLDQAFAKDPAQRWQSAAAAAAALRRIRASLDEPTLVLSNTSATVPKAQNTHRNRLLAALLLVLLVVCAAVFAGRRFFAGESLPEEKRIAVLPFSVPGNDASVQALADGLVETLTSKLSQIDEFQEKLMVVPASEVRSRHITSAEAARRIYRANLAITGSAQRWEDRIQFTLNLVDTASIRQLASKTFDFDAVRAIAVREAAVNGAVRLLALKLLPGSSASLSTGETSKPGAYAKYLEGVGYLARYDIAGNVDRAIASLTTATQLDPQYALAFSALGEAHWRKARLESSATEVQSAIANIQNAIRLDPRSADARVKLADVYSENGRPQDAIQEAEAVLRIARENAEAWRALAQAYAAGHQDREAEAAYRSAIQRQPANWYAHAALGLFYLDRGRIADARSEYEEARRLTPDNEIVYRNLAVLDMQEGNFRGASDLISKTLKFDPNTRTYSALGIAYYYQRRYQEAADAIKAGIALDPNQYRSWGNLGTVYRHMPGSEREAREAFEKAISLAGKALGVRKSDDDRTHANLGEYWAKLGEKQRALAEIASIPPPARGPFMDRIVLAYELTGNRKQAIEAAKSMPPGSAALLFLKNDPDLESFWRDPAWTAVK